MRPLRSLPLRHVRLTSLVLISLLAAGFACRSRAAEVLARVGGTDVTVEEVRTYVETLGAAEQAALAKDPALLSQAVRVFLTRQAVLHEAQGKKFEQQALVKAHLDRVHDQALIELYLDSVSRPPDGYPADGEIQAAYDASKTSFEVPRQFRVSQLYVSAPGAADKAAEEKARRKLDELLRRARARPADFTALARAESEDKQSAAQGGEIGWLTEAQMVPGIRATVMALPKDAVSEPLRLDDGWHVLKVTETRAATTKPLPEVRDAIVSQLRAARSQQLRQAYLAKLVEQGAPAINELALSKVLTRAR